MPRPSALPITPEIEILLCCARNPSNLTRRSRLEELLVGPLDWDVVLDEANENGLLPLVCAHLLRDSKLQIAPEIRERLGEENRGHSMRSLLQISELFCILDALREKQILALPWKGPTLAQLAYGNPMLRQFEDLDFVVPQKNIPDVYSVMDSLGYLARFPRERASAADLGRIPGEYAFFHPQQKSLVEFHTEFTLRHFPRPPTVEEMGRGSVSIHMNGRSIATFCAPDNLLMLCVHGSKDFWSRLIWIADIAALAEEFAAAEWQQLFAEAQKCGATRMVNLGLRLAQTIFQTSLPAEVFQRVMQDRVASRIAARFTDGLIQTGDFADGILSRSRYRIAMVPGLPNGIRYWLRLSTTPAEDDWSAKPSAEHSGLRRSLLRPFRLWRKFSRAGASQPLDSQNS